MNNITALEYQRDAAKSRLDKIERAEGDCQETIQNALGLLQETVGFTDKDRNAAAGAMWEILSDLIDGITSDIKREVGRIDDEIGNAEWHDRERDRPIVL
jgi:hypothetical protein